MRKLSFLILLIFLSSTASAKDYFVSPSGNDLNSGTTQLLSWQTISKVNSVDFNPGDRILLEGGQVFYGNLYLDSRDANDPSKVLIISSFGNGKAIINGSDGNAFYSYNTQGFTIENLIFEGSGIYTNKADGFSIYADVAGDIKFQNISIKNVEIRNFGAHGLLIGSWSGNTGFKNVLIDNVHIHHVLSNGLFIYGYDTKNSSGSPHQNIIIRNTVVHDVPGFANPNSHSGSGIIMAQVDGGLIEHCVAYNNGTGNIHCGGPGGIWAYSCNNITIQYCESHNNSSGAGCDGLGFDFDGGVTNSIMQYNYSHDNDGAGYLLGQYENARPWGNNIVRFNISENDGRTNGGGITLFKGNNTTFNGLKIYQNTIYITPSNKNTGSYFGAFTIVNWQQGINGVEVYNNIFQTAGGAPLISVPTGYKAYFAGNLYWANNETFLINYQDIIYNNLSEWRSATQNEQIGDVATGITDNPLLTNVGKGIIVYPNPPEKLNAYMLDNYSPAKSKGLNLKKFFGIESGERDFFNNKISNGFNPDIGAYSNYVEEIINTSVSITGSKEFCQGDSVILSAHTSNSYLWSTGETTQSIVVKASGNYYVRITNYQGNSAVSESISIIVHSLPLPIIESNDDLTFCQGDSILLSASTAISYLWNNGATTRSLIVKESGLYSVFITDSNGCSASSDEIKVTVNPLPIVEIKNLGNLEFCSGDSVLLSSSIANSYLWNNGATTRSIIVKESGVYSIFITDSNGCSASSNDIKVTVFDKPEVPIINAKDNVLISSSEMNNQWYLNGNIIEGETNKIYHATQDGIYTVKVTNINNCYSISSPYELLLISVKDLGILRPLFIRPNPASDYIIISLSKKGIKPFVAGEKVQISDVLGIEIMSIGTDIDLATQRIDISHLPVGLYFIQFANYTEKFMVVR